MTNGLSWKRWSCVTSETCSTFGCRMAWPQTECSRGVPPASSPISDLNHWRSGSTSETRAIATSKILTASGTRPGDAVEAILGHRGEQSKAAPVLTSNPPLKYSRVRTATSATKYLRDRAGLGEERDVATMSDPTVRLRRDTI